MEHIVSVPSITELKLQTGNIQNVILTLGQATIGDGFGKFYYYDSTDSTTAEDTLYYNVVVPANNVGRFKAVFTRMLALPHGTLVINGGKREFYYNGVTAADGTCLVNLTMDGTTNGAAIFNTVWFDDSKATANVSDPNDAVGSCRKSLSGNLKQLTHLFYRGGSSLLSLSIVTTGLTVLGFRTAVTNTPVTFCIVGK